MKDLLKIVILVILSGLGPIAHGQLAGQPDVNAKTKTLFIYNFTKYVEWPAEQKIGPFVIGFYGDYPALFEELKAMASQKTAGSQEIVITNFGSVNFIAECHMLYVNEDKGGELAAIVKKTSGMPMLIVTDMEGSASQGSCINFYYEASKQRMEISPDNISKRELKVSGQLLSLAKVIR